MKRIKTATIACMICTVVLTSACGADPCAGLSDESYDKVVNYAAGMLMKYTVGSQDKLTYLDPTYTPEYLVAEAGKEDSDAQTQSSAQLTSTSAQTDNSSVSSTVDKTDSSENEMTKDESSATKDHASTGQSDSASQTEDENAGSGSGDSAGDNAGEGTTNATESTTGYETGSTQLHSRQDGELAAENTVMDASYLQSLSDSIQIEYIGYSIRNNYPDAQSQGAVSAAMGDKILVVTFHARNTSDEELLFNTIRSGVKYKLVINSDISGFCLTTMLDNDLSGVYANIPANDYKEVVLLMEIPESVSKNIQSLGLVISNKGEQQTVQLE